MVNIKNKFHFLKAIKGKICDINEISDDKWIITFLKSESATSFKSDVYKNPFVLEYVQGAPCKKPYPLSGILYPEGGHKPSNIIFPKRPAIFTIIRESGFNVQNKLLGEIRKLI